MKEILTTYIDKELAKLIKAEAKAKDWSVSKVIEKILTKNYSKGK